MAGVYVAGVCEAASLRLIREKDGIFQRAQKTYKVSGLGMIRDTATFL